MVQTLVRRQPYGRETYWPLPCEFLMVSSLLQRKFATKFRIKLSFDSFIVQRRESVLNVIGIIKIKLKSTFVIVHLLCTKSLLAIKSLSL